MPANIAWEADKRCDALVLRRRLIGMPWSVTLAIIALVLGVCSLILSVANRRSIRLLRLENRRTRASSTGLLPKPPDEETVGRPYVVYNPTKSADWDDLKAKLASAAADASLPEPVWLETTADDPGTGQTQQAIEAGASVVIAAGGDGTVRTVSEALTGTQTPLGLLPLGTGNVLARNLNLPLDDAKQMAIIALTGKARPMDVGVMVIGEPDAERVAHASDMGLPEDKKLAKPGEYPFVVNAGVGFDAAIMDEADANSELKAKFGWAAYVKAAVPHLLAPKMKVTISVGNNKESLTTDARSVMLLNGGELVGGVVLEPGAKLDDGWLELLVMDTRGGLIGWADLVRRIGLKGIGVKNVDLPGIQPTGELDVHRISECHVSTDNVHPVQVDGDVLGYASEFDIRLDPLSLLVRVRD